MPRHARVRPISARAHHACRLSFHCEHMLQSNSRGTGWRVVDLDHGYNVRSMSTRLEHKTTLHEPENGPPGHMRGMSMRPQCATHTSKRKPASFRSPMRSSDHLKNPHSHPSPEAFRNGEARPSNPPAARALSPLSSCHLILMQVLYVRCGLTAPLHPRPPPPRRRGRIQRAHPPTVLTQE